MNVLKEWSIFFSTLFKPLVLLPVGLGALSLYFANIEVKNPSLSLLLNIIAAALTAIAGGAFLDRLKDLMGNTILIKKGDSAVRNLSTTRIKVKNIIERSRSKASNEELENLLALLEKDVANSIQEWNDILPDVQKKEIAYILLEEREKELEITKNEKKSIESKLQEAQAKGEASDKLSEELEAANDKVKNLSMEVERLKIYSTLSSTVSSTLGTSGYGTSGSSLYSGISGISGKRVLSGISAGTKYISLCKKCGKMFSSELEDKSELCDECMKKS